LRKLHDLGLAPAPAAAVLLQLGRERWGNAVPAESCPFVPSLAPNRTAPDYRSLLRGADWYFGWKVTGLTIMQKRKLKKPRTKPDEKRESEQKVRRISFECVVQMGLGTGSPHLPAPDLLSSASSDSSDSLSHAFS